MKRFLLFFLSSLLVLLLPISVYAQDQDDQQYTITIKYVFHSGLVEDDNIIYQFSKDPIIASPGDDVFVPTLGISNFNYHIDGYPDEITWNLGEKEVLGGGNPEPLEDDEWADFHTPSMIAEDVDIIFHYTPYTDRCLLEHYFEQEDGSYQLQKTQKTNLAIYDIYNCEYDLSKYYLKIDNYTFDVDNPNNILTGYPVFRTADKQPFTFKYYYNLINKPEPTTEEETTEEETTTEEQTTEQEETTTEEQTSKEEETTTEEQTTEKQTTTQEETTTEEQTTTQEETTTKKEEVTTEKQTTTQEETTTKKEETTTQEETTTKKEEVTTQEETTSSNGNTQEETTTQQETTTTREEETTTALMAIPSTVIPPRPQPYVNVRPRPNTQTTTKEEETTTIEIEEMTENDVPLAAPPTKTNHWALLNLLLTIGSIIISICLGFLLLHDDEDDEEYDDSIVFGYTYKEKKQNRKSVVKRLFSIIISIIMIFVFLLTEDITLPMKFVDEYTLLMIIIFIINIIVALIWRRPSEEEDYDDEDEY